MSDYFLIARIISAYGRNGFVRITSFSDFPERFFKLKKIYLDFFGDKKEFIVEEVKKQKDFFIFKFKNFDNENDVRVLINKEIYVHSKNAVKLPKDHFFIHDLIGSKVLKNNVEFGIIIDVLNYPANDVYIIKNNQGKEVLIPAVYDFIESFNAKNKILVLKPGKELYEEDNED